MISKIGLPPFIVTLGMENLARGMALHYNNRFTAFCFRIFYLNRSASLRQDQFLEYPFSSSYYNNFGDCIYLYEVFKDMQEYILRRKQ